YGVDFDGDGRVDLRHSVPDVLASTANLLHTNGFKMGAPYDEASANFEAMREWNHAIIYRKTIAYFADQLVGRGATTVITGRSAGSNPESRDSSFSPAGCPGMTTALGKG